MISSTVKHKVRNQDGSGLNVCIDYADREEMIVEVINVSGTVDLGRTEQKVGVAISRSDLMELFAQLETD